MTFSIIQKSQLEGAQRIDAEYYQPEYLVIQKSLSKQKTVPLVKVATISSGPAYSSSEMEDDFDFPIARIGDITRKTNREDWIKISRKEFEKFHSKKINDFDILMTMTGDPPDVGKCNIYRLKNGEVIAFNQRVARISSRINPYYLFAYLSTKYARLQTERNALGIRQRNVATNDIRNIQVISLSEDKQDTIGKIIEKYISELASSQQLIKLAEDLLLEELGLKDIQFEDDLIYIVNSREINNANRADAEYFQPKFDKLIELLKKYQIVDLKKVIQDVPAQFNPYLEPDKTFKYVELADINSSIGVIENGNEILGKEAPSRARRLLKTDDVIISSVEGSLEKVALVSKDQEGFLASTGFFQFRSNKILPEVLLILAKSIVLQWQFKKHCAGTILTAVPADALNKMTIPILPKPTQQKIAALVRQSHTSRQKSKELLEMAKKKVEELIEATPLR